MSSPRYLPPFAITLTSTRVFFPINSPLFSSVSLRAALAHARLRVWLFGEEFEEVRLRFEDIRGARLDAPPASSAVHFLGPLMMLRIRFLTGVRFSRSRSCLPFNIEVRVW